MVRSYENKVGAKTGIKRSDWINCMVGRIPFAFLKRPPSQEEHTTVYRIQKTFNGTTSSLCGNFQNF
jgi:hypothetical protein